VQAMWRARSACL